jgi:hypothetical protein
LVVLPGSEPVFVCAASGPAPSPVDMPSIS